MIDKSPMCELQGKIRRCTRCITSGYAVEGPAIFSGNRGARIMLVGQAPGRVEVYETHKPFSGSAGRRLFRWLAQAGWEEKDVRRYCYITSVTKCYPGASKDGRGDRAPSLTERRLCAGWLEHELDLIEPAVVIPIGALSATHFLGPGIRLADIIGQRFQVEGRIIIPLPHPSGASFWLHVSRNQELTRQAICHLADVRSELEWRPGS